MNSETRPGIQPTKPIQETEHAVSYLGVRLEKAKDRSSHFVPARDAYKDFINDRFSTDLQRKIAVSWHQGDPMLIEGGTSIGKTTTVRKMAAELGYEVHYANLNGATDVEDLMGRYIPNPNKHGAEDPEYIFADGKVTSGLRPEEGKTKVIILDEFNSAAPNILIRLHEVLDSLQGGEDVVLSEDASEAVSAVKQRTKVVALMNPPGKGYFGREPLDPAQLRRWSYTKAPTELPRETFSHSTKALFGLASNEQSVTEDHSLPSREVALLPEQLQEIPGIADILPRYEEFHHKAKELVKERRVGADQPQTFTYDDRMEPKRVRDFILNFYNGDINGTMQEALRYYYANKLESDVDKDKLEEAIRLVEYVPPRVDSERIPLGEPEGQPAPVSPSNPRSPESASVPSSELERREQDAWNEILGSRVEIKPLPAFVTPDVQRNLERAGLALRYIPELKSNKSRLETKGADQYIEYLESQYPQWRAYEGLSSSEQSDHSVSRNMRKWFWEQAEKGAVNFPELPGQWIAVETVDKPEYGGKYDRTLIGDKLGFKRENRFGTSWITITRKMADKKAEILRDMDISGRADVRLLETAEWNLLANREGWGKTDTYEWTNTEYRASGLSLRLVAGYSDLGGAAYVHWRYPDSGHSGIGWRAAVVLGS